MLNNITEQKASNIIVQRLQSQYCNHFSRTFCNFINDLVFV